MSDKTELGFTLIVSEAVPVDQVLLVSDNVSAGKPPHVILIQHVGHPASAEARERGEGNSG